MSTTIIGSGVAAWTLVRELRKADPEHEIVVITQNNGDFYSKPMLSNALASGKTAESLVMNPGNKLAEQQNVSLITNTAVTAIEPGSNTLRTSSGDFNFDKLVLCLGASTIKLPLAGDAANAILSVNDLDDYALFRKHLEGKHSVALLGAGLIGCEFANDLRKGGFEVIVYDLAERPLPKLLPEQASQFMREKLAAIGVQWKLGCSVMEVNKTETGYLIIHSNGDTLDTDLVLSAVGLLPHTELAEQAGLLTDKGIVIDQMGCTSAPRIYALGDCAQYFGSHVLPYIMPVMQGARAMAKTLAGESTPINFPPMPVTVKTPDCPTVICPPVDATAGHWQVECTQSGVRALFNADDGTLLGIALLGDFTKERQALTSQLPSIN